MPPRPQIFRHDRQNPEWNKWQSSHRTSPPTRISPEKPAAGRRGPCPLEGARAGDADCCCRWRLRWRYQPSRPRRPPSRRPTPTRRTRCWNGVLRGYKRREEEERRRRCWCCPGWSARPGTRCRTRQRGERPTTRARRRPRRRRRCRTGISAEGAMPANTAFRACAAAPSGGRNVLRRLWGIRRRWVRWEKTGFCLCSFSSWC
mmetsp:Transcript_28888/g.61313  ORF Transcript_28888/g.61313 Transcript_28888/m.61313 type:complete len:203 (+) Transcript_28888:1407-2015(+)